MQSNRRQNQDSERVTGEVLEVRVLKGSWGKLRIEGCAHAVMGEVLGVSVGDCVEVKGRVGHDPKYGSQLKASLIRRTVPSDSRGVVAWLASRLPAVGKKRAALLVERFGVPGIYDTIANDPAALATVPGITPALADSIRAEYGRVKGEQEELTQLLGWGLTDGQIKRCREVFGTDIIGALRRDPYRLSDEVHGFGWKRADALVRAMGLPADHPTRIRACVLHALSDAEQAGHCFIPRGALVRCVVVDLVEAFVGLDIPERDVHQAIDTLCGEGKAVADGRAIYRPATHFAEAFVADRVRRMAA